jgi:hypothetical protein
MTARTSYHLERLNSRYSFNPQERAEASADGGDFRVEHQRDHVFSGIDAD